MAVFRVERTRDYTVMCNHHLKDSNLSLKAKGLLSMMLSLPDEWNYTTRGLAAICKEGVDAIGKIIKPNYVTNHFKVLLKENNMRPIRFHDLRHSCASLLLSQGVPMKMIQDWLGHSDMSTTANIYSHIDSESKLASARAIGSALN